MVNLWKVVIRPAFASPPVNQPLRHVEDKDHSSTSEHPATPSLSCKSGLWLQTIAAFADQGILNLHGKIFLETCNEDVVTTSNHTADTNIPDVNRVQK